MAQRKGRKEAKVRAINLMLWKPGFSNLNSSANAQLNPSISLSEAMTLIEANRQFKGWLKENIDFVDIDTPGYAHEWSYWRLCLVDFADDFSNNH